MKKVILIINLLLLSTILFGQGIVYQDFGLWNYSEGSNVVGLEAFITVEKIVKCNDPNAIKIDTCNRYRVYVVSNSIYENDTTSTWLYGVRIYANNFEISKNQFPDGFLVSVSTEPTEIYSYDAKHNEDVEMGLSWDRAVYDPRIRK